MRLPNLLVGSIGLLLALGLLRLADAQSTTLQDGVIKTKAASGITSFVVDADGDVGDLGEVAIGASGAVPADIDFEVRDPNPSFPNPFGPVFRINASIGTVTVGSGTMAFPGVDGEVLVQNGLGETLVQLDGGTGNIEQEVDNIAIANGNGAVKAWAKIDSDGGVFQCWKCNLQGSQTRRLGVGDYEVDFLVGNIQARPRLAIVDSHTTTAVTTFSVAVFGSSDTSTVSVRTRVLTDAALSDAAFTVFVF